MDNLINELWEYAEKRNKKIYNWLNMDNLSNIVVDNDIFWFEMVCGRQMPNCVYYWLKKWCNKKGLTYLYDIPTK